MTIVTSIFMFGFLPVFLLVYYLSGQKIKKYVLLLGSICFYAFTLQKAVIWILLLCVLVYLMSLLYSVFKKKHQLFSDIICMVTIAFLVVLLFFTHSLADVLQKIYDMAGIYFNRQIITDSFPIGFSFLCFSMISYMTDLYRGEILAEKNLFSLCTYFLMFPKMLMGPLEKYPDFKSQMLQPAVSFQHTGEGMTRFILGFCKKVIIADNLALLVGQVMWVTDFSKLSVTSLWLISICYSLELFIDISAYYDCALGLAQMLGFRLREGFDYPYCADNMKHFWSRWNMTLVQWFKEYIYRPLAAGSTRKIQSLTAFLMTVFLFIIWHGCKVNFFICGGIFLGFLLIERYLVQIEKQKKSVQLLWRIFMLVVINICWVFVYFPDMGQAVSFCMGMFGLTNNSLFSADIFRDVREYGIYILGAIFVVTPACVKLKEWIQEHDRYGVLAIISPIILLALFIWAMSFVMVNGYQEFLFQKF